MAWTQEKINDVYSQVQKLASSDGEFRNELMRDTNSVISRIAGEPLPEKFSVNVIESNSNYSATIALPPMFSGELSDSDLMAVAGGAKKECEMGYSVGL